MSDSAFNADLDALVQGDPVTSNDELTRFVSDLYVEEKNAMMPNMLKLRIANDLGLTPNTQSSATSAPVSRRTMRAAAPPRRRGRPWTIALAVAAAILLALTGVLRLGMPTDDPDSDNQFLLSSPAVPTVAATPEATPEATPGSEDLWLQPISSEECPEDELMDRGERMQLQQERAASYNPDDPKVDEPFSQANTDDAEAVVERQRQSMACQNRGDDAGDRASEALPIESPARSWEMQADSESFQAIQKERLERSKVFSSWVSEEMGLTPADLFHPADSEPSLIWLPSGAIEMGDGRIAILPSWLVPEGQPTPDSIELYAPVWVEADGEWLFEEELFFCIGECDEYWSQLEGLFPNESTPVASPEAIDEYDESWMLPVEPEQCVTNAAATDVDVDPQDFDAEQGREYQVMGPANPADAMVANEVARQSQACADPTSLWSSRLAMENELAGEEFSPFTIVILQQQWEGGQVISDALEAEGLQPTDFLLVAGGDNSMFADIEDGSYFLSNPYMALELEDGRMVIPWVELTVAKDEMSGARIQQWYAGTALVLAEEDGSWKVDGQLPICVGDCDAVWDELNGMLWDAVYLIPVNAAECDANTYLPNDLGEAEAAVVRSRQYIACSEAGDFAALQGPDFRVTDGEEAQPLPDDIAEKHRQNGETPGSLQRIANTQMWSADYELPSEPWSVFQPTSVVTLEDGRVAVLETTVVTPDLVSGTGRTSPVVTTALIWDVEDETWLLDEQVTVCLGNCDEFWGTESTPEAATPQATEIAVVIPEACANSDEFVADFTSHDRLPIQLRPEPITQAGVYVEVLMPRAPLQYLCESEETSKPAQDRMQEGQVWLKIRTEDGTEGWIREVDVRRIEP